MIYSSYYYYYYLNTDIRVHTVVDDVLSRRLRETQRVRATLQQIERRNTRVAPEVRLFQISFDRHDSRDLKES